MALLIEMKSVRNFGVVRRFGFLCTVAGICFCSKSWYGVV